MGLFLSPLVILVSLLSTQVLSLRFLINKQQHTCLWEHLPKNQELVTQIIVDSSTKDFEVMVLHLNEKGKLLDTRVVRTYNSRDIFTHFEGR